ncbi:52 kDa repressor of the inhibitor of the protein kinase-like [Sipha flava]|uniref:52 kDa repressor of the inhibitor of the protein kinase-like n=1 Tax=Sipha flava TaxID=143950 RepID=A0A8B8G3R0_9HEMI|nr:52 kDa repressor of the inhibitor of the protein kinase-like [Sipha flava]
MHESVRNDTESIYDSSDVGDFIDIHPIPEDKKYSLLINPYKPTINYNFKNDMASNSKRAFNLKGKQGSFIITPFTKFYQIIEESKKHEKTQWHNDSKVTAKLFLDSMNSKKINVMEQINSSVHKEIEDNRNKLRPIIKSILFCGQHDIALRGNTADKVIRNDIVSQVNNSVAFSLLADETADIAGKEQLSIGVRYIDINYVVHEEFIGFSEIHVLNAEGVSRSILESTEKYGLNMLKLVGLGFDGCSTMSGKENGVQAIIRKIYPTACYFHCASHKLNLVVNDQNSIPEIRNTIGTVKEIIKFFRESILRRKLIPNIPLFCETRWSENSEANAVTRNRAFQLSSATSNCTFLISLKVIAYYSSVLEPVVTKLQGTSVNLHSVHTFVKTELLGILNKHREHSIEYFNTIFEEITKAANSLDFVLKIPRRTNHQSQRSNHNYSSNDSIEDYYRVSMYIPYLDSIITSLNNRFNENNETPFKLCWLLPNEMNKHFEHERNLYGK